MPKLEDLQSLLAADPTDSFTRYAVAMELVKRGDLPAALAEFATLIANDPAYVPAYFMAGRAQVQAGDFAAARDLYQRGIQAAQAAGDLHAAGEIAQALDELPA